jgi:hypothetical protein
VSSPRWTQFAKSAASRSPLALALFAALLGWSVLAFVGPVSAQAPAFSAEVQGHATRPAGCPDGAFVCGDATVAGYGAAEYRFFLESLAPGSPSCGNYTATVTFTLTVGGTLTLHETGTVCGPGRSFFPVPAPGGSYGNPVDGIGSWEVQGGSGQFAGATGSGTDTFRSAGASFSASYAGDLQG